MSREMGRLIADLARRSGAMDPRLIEHWPDIAGENLTRMCRPLRLRTHGRAKSLEVAVPNGAAAMQVQFRQKELIDRVNRVLGKGTVTRLLIRQTGAAGLAAAQKPAYSQPVMPVDAETPKPMTAGPVPETVGASLERLRRLIATRGGSGEA